MDKWKLENSSRGYKFYLYEKLVTKAHNKYKIYGTLSVRVNGPNTAYCTFDNRCINFDNVHFGFVLGKHFNGHNASHKARGWFNYMLGNIPDYYSEYKKKPDKIVRGRNGNNKI